MTKGTFRAIELLERRVLWAAGDLDATFGTGGVVRDNVSGTAGGADYTRDFALDAAGRIVALGHADGDDAGMVPVVRRYLSSGALDTSFGGGDGTVHLPISSASEPFPWAIAIQPDGKILLAGHHWTRTNATIVDGQVTKHGTSNQDISVYRLNADGSPDTSFGGGDGVGLADFGGREEAVDLALAPDGKIVVTGYTMEDFVGGGGGSQTSQFALARFNADGTLDSSFSDDGKIAKRIGDTSGFGQAVTVQADGKVIMAGMAKVITSTATEQSILMRFDTDGGMDGSFGAAGVVAGRDPKDNNDHKFLAVTVDSAGRILAGGADAGGVVMRYLPDGTLDTTFGTAGRASHPRLDAAADLAIDGDGNVIAVGNVNGMLGLGAVRFNSGGAVDAGFGGAGAVASAFGYVADASGHSVAIAPDGKIVVSGGTSHRADADFLIARFEGGAGGAPDPELEEPTPGNTVWPFNGDWTIVVDATPAGEAMMLVHNQTGRKVLLPKPSSDGSVSITGSEEADTIAVERVDALPAPADDRIYKRVYLRTSQRTIGMEYAYLAEPGRFQKVLDAEKRALTDAQSRLDQAVAQGASPSELKRAKLDVARAQEHVTRDDAVAAALASATGFVRYRLEGVYDVYVALTPGAIKSTARIRVDAAGGNDVVAVANNVPMKASLGGGWGADKLTSGSRRSMLYGGGGSDRLFSRSRHGGALDGGKGADRFYNRFGEVQILARGDGDCVMIDGSAVPVAQPGTLGISSPTSPTPGKCYFLTEGDEGQTDLLA